MNAGESHICGVAQHGGNVHVISCCLTILTSTRRAMASYNLGLLLVDKGQIDGADGAVEAFKQCLRKKKETSGECGTTAMTPMRAPCSPSANTANQIRIRA